MNFLIDTLFIVVIVFVLGGAALCVVLGIGTLYFSIASRVHRKRKARYERRLRQARKSYVFHIMYGSNIHATPEEMMMWRQLCADYINGGTMPPMTLEDLRKEYASIIALMPGRTP